MSHQNQPSDRNQGGHERGPSDAWSLLLGERLAKLAEKLDKVLAAAAAGNAKLDRLIDGAGDLTPEAKAAFQVQIDRLNELATPTTP